MGSARRGQDFFGAVDVFDSRTLDQAIGILYDHLFHSRTAHSTITLGWDNRFTLVRFHCEDEVGLRLVINNQRQTENIDEVVMAGEKGCACAERNKKDEGKWDGVNKT